MTQRQWFKLKQGDIVIMKTKRNPRKILSVSGNNRTFFITLPLQRYVKKEFNTTTYCLCDCTFFSKIKSKRK